MAFYEFTQEDFAKVIDDPRFLSGVKMLVEECFFPSAQSFRGDSQLLQKLELCPREELYDHVKDYPLPYITICEDPTFYEKNYGKDHPCTRNVQEDVATRQMLIDRAITKLDPAWWCGIHWCQDLALFLIYPLCRLLFPETTFYLYSGFYHTVITNFDPGLTQFKGRRLTRNIHEPCIFDLVSLLLNLDMDWIFERVDRPSIPSHKMMEWHIDNFSYRGMDPQKYHRWFATIP